MTQFRDAAHVNSARLAVALAERGYLTPDQAAQMCDGRVSLRNFQQAREALRGAVANSDGNAAYLAELLGDQLGVALKTQVMAERMGYTERGLSLREGQGDQIRDMYAGAIARSGGGVVDQSGIGINVGINSNGVNIGINSGVNGGIINDGCFGNGTAGPFDYNTSSSSPLSTIAAFAIGGFIGSQLSRRNNNRWNDTWGNGWVERVPRRNNGGDFNRNPIVPTTRNPPSRVSPPIARPPADRTQDRTFRPPPSITQPRPPVSRPPQRVNDPQRQPVPHDPPRRVRQ